VCQLQKLRSDFAHVTMLMGVSDPQETLVIMLVKQHYTECSNTAVGFYFTSGVSCSADGLPSFAWYTYVQWFERHACLSACIHKSLRGFRAQQSRSDQSQEFLVQDSFKCCDFVRVRAEYTSSVIASTATDGGILNFGNMSAFELRDVRHVFPVSIDLAK